MRISNFLREPHCCGLVRILSRAAFENAGPLRPDFSEPKYAHTEYIWVSKGGTYADRWYLRSRGFRKPGSWPAHRRAAKPHQSRRTRPRAANAVAGVDTRSRARHGASLSTREERDLAGRVAVHGALCQGDQRTEDRTRRGHPGAQLSDARDLPLRRRHPRRFAAARDR